MKTMVCVPCMDTVQTDFVRSLVAMRPVGDVVPEFVAGSVVYHSRNRLAQKAVDEGYDYTMWLDSDMVFPPNLMEVLMEDMTGKNLVTGVCHMRRPPYRRVPHAAASLQALHLEDPPPGDRHGREPERRV